MTARLLEVTCVKTCPFLRQVLIFYMINNAFFIPEKWDVNI